MALLFSNYVPNNKKTHHGNILLSHRCVYHSSAAAPAAAQPHKPLRFIACSVFILVYFLHKERLTINKDNTQRTFCHLQKFVEKNWIVVVVVLFNINVVYLLKPKQY
jgi:hypothetical protein